MNTMQGMGLHPSFLVSILVGANQKLLRKALFMASKVSNYVEFSVIILFLVIQTQIYAFRFPAKFSDGCKIHIPYTRKHFVYLWYQQYTFMMAQAQKVHLGQNIRDMRVLKGMKQETLGKKMGMAQQNVSKMEQKELPTEEILERAAKAMGTTVEAIKKFNKNSDFQFFFYTTNQHNHPIKEVIQYFKEELLKEYEEKEALKDELSKLKTELEALKNGSASESSAADGNVRKIKGK